MLLALLLHVLIFHLLSARDAPARKNTQYIIQNIDVCPAVGYYFWRERSSNALEPGSCFLCFCQEDHTALCWKRNNRRCNVQSYKHHAGGKRSYMRIRRSPGLADISFHDATRDAFNRNEKQKFKPYESSLTEDRPPGESNKIGNRKGSMRTKKPERKSKISTSSIPKRTPPHTAKKFKPVIKVTTTPSLSINSTNNNSTQQQTQRIIKKYVLVKSDVSPGQKRRIRYKTIAPTKSEARKVTTTMITKNIGTQKPIDIGATKGKLETEIAKKIMEKIMINIKQSIDSEIKNITNIAGSTARNEGYKKQAKKPQGKPPSKWKKPIKNPTKIPVKKLLMKLTKQPVTYVQKHTSGI